MPTTTQNKEAQDPQLAQVEAQHRYPAYKDSGIPWLGEIPEHWEVVKLKYLLKESKSAIKPGPFGSDLKNTDIIQHGKYKVYTQRNVLDNNFEKGEDFVSNEKFQMLRAFKIEDNDILITTRGTIGKCAIFPKGAVIGILHPCLIRIQNKEEHVTKEWVMRFFNDSNYFGYEVKSKSNSTILDVIYSGTLKETNIPLPPLPEQKAIADYLDDKCAKLDDLIAKKQRLLALLDEERQALINKAVTRGLNPDAPLKDSGIPWLGEIPEHWEIRPLGYSCVITTGSRNTEDKKAKGVYPFFVRSQRVERIDTFSFDCEGILTAGDGVGVGKVFHYVKGSFEVHQRVYLFHNFVDSFSVKFVFQYLRIKMMDELMMHNSKSTVDSIRRPVLISFPLVNPPLPEQKAIADYLDDKCARLDQSKQATRRQIELLKEYRQALISEVVTGKRRVV